VTTPPLIQQLALRNYKSVGVCTLRLRPLTLFVGRNGAGKSNIVDALRFTRDALDSTLEFAMRERGGIDQVRRRSPRRPTNFAMSLRVELAEGIADYRFEISAVSGGRFSVSSEQCRVVAPFRPPSVYQVTNGEVESWSLDSKPPSAAADRLFLVAASGQPEFAPLFDALRRMAFHNLSPDAMKQPRKPEPGLQLARDGHNLASVVKELQQSEHPSLARAAEYLRRIGVPVSSLRHRQLGAFETVEFEQEATKGRKWRFDASSMSDGTLRALGILVSVLSSSNGSSLGPTLVGIEEPESALHPAASSALMDALIEGAERTQIVITCHSPDLLEHPELEPDSILLVANDSGLTKVAPLSETTKQILREHLSSSAELQRLDQLIPDASDLERQEHAQGMLFDDAI